MSNIFASILHKLDSGVRHLIQGDGVSSRFFKRHFFSTALIVMGCMMVIAMRFDCLTSDNVIDRLEVEINVMATEKQKQRSLYKTLTRESAMMHLVDSLQLGLIIPDVHPQNISYSEP